MCGRVRDPNIEEVSEIKLNHFRRRRDRIRGDWRPGQNILVVILEGCAWKLEKMRWGLIPAGSESDHLDYSTYNARSERVSETPTYRNAWHQGRRCLIPAEGFYERRHYFTLHESPLMAFAGLWDEWKNPIGGVMRTCTMLTCTPNELVGRVHNRMPVIIARENWNAWLGEESATELVIKALLKPYPAGLMTVTPPLGNKSEQSQEKHQLRLF